MSKVAGIEAAEAPLAAGGAILKPSHDWQTGGLLAAWRGALGCLVFWACPVAAAGDAPPDVIELRFSAPAECGSKERVLAELSRALGPDSDSRGWSAVIQVKQIPGEKEALGRWMLELEATRGDVVARRRLELDQCNAAVEASALFLLLTIDPSRARELTSPAPEEEPTAPISEEPPPEPAEPSTNQSPEPPAEQPGAAAVPAPVAEVRYEEAPAPSQHDAERKWRAWLGAGAVWHSGETAGPGFGAALQGGVGWGGWALGVRGEWLAETAVPIRVVPDGEVAMWGVGAQLEARYSFRSGALAVAPLVGLGGRFVEARALGISDPGAPGNTNWWTFHGGAEVSYQLLNRTGVFLYGAAVVPLDPPPFTVTGLGVVHRPQEAAAEVGLGLSWSWGSQ